MSYIDTSGIAYFKQKLDSLYATKDEVAAAIEGVSSKFPEYDESFKAVTRRLDVIEHDLGELDAAVKALGERVSEVESLIQQLLKF